MANCSNLVLLTGGSGHVGFRTLVHALRAGYTVRAAVRSQSKANLILSQPEIQSLNPAQRLTFCIVPDIVAPSAYDEAIQGVRYVIHIASPLMSDGEIPLREHDDHYIRPAVRGTLNMLEAAEKSGTVRRVVITSSIVALVSVARMEGVEQSDVPVQPTDRVPFVSGPYETEFAAYAASKVAALQAAENWIKTTRPAFEVIHLHPSFIEGRNDLASSPREVFKGTNAIVLGILLGKHFGSFIGATVHNEDVARVHVQALHPAIPGNESYILSQPTRWNDAKDIVRREFPEAIQKRVLQNTGSAMTHELATDTSLTERTFDFTHLNYEDQVKSVVGHYLELRSRKTVRMRQPPNDALNSLQQLRASA